MAQSQSGSTVEVRNKAAGNSHIKAVDEGPCNLFVHFTRSVSTGTGIDRISISDVHKFVGMAVCTADLSLRRVDGHEDGWQVVLQKE
jgi:hypothetical protein